MTFRFGTKAETLERLRPLVTKSSVPEGFHFDVAAWEARPDELLLGVQERFPQRLLAVRSSAIAEDGASASMAGKFVSRLGVASAHSEQVRQAVRAVIASFRGNPKDQVLVQPLQDSVTVSGVVTTYVLEDGGPYYVICYDDESGRTDTITGGTGVNKTVLVHRDSGAEMIESERVRRWVAVVRELEELCGNAPLDIEFAERKDGGVIVLQVRQISVQRNWNREVQQRVRDAQAHLEEFLAFRSLPRPALVGRRTILGEMPDWNPAEMIGTTPRPLAASLYKYLITDHVWRRARAAMGYRHPRGESLMVLIAGRPYIDVRNSFNSFLPADLDERVGHLLVDAWIDRLDRHPEFHDKVEFDVAITALDFGFDAALHDRYHGLLSDADRAAFRAGLQRITEGAIAPNGAGTLERSLASVQQLDAAQAERSRASLQDDASSMHLVTADRLLREAREQGTLAFAAIARHAFIAELLLRSAVAHGAFAAARLDALKRSLFTVTAAMTRDLRRVCEAAASPLEFMARYGHLRPGTYDILSLRYDQRGNLFDNVVLPQTALEHAGFELSAEERAALAELLRSAGFARVTPDDLVRYAFEAMRGREYAKFVFTRNLSDALEAVAAWGEAIGLSRDDLSYLTWPQIVQSLHVPLLERPLVHFNRVAEEARAATSVSSALRLSYLIRGTRDLFVAPLHRCAPNFVTAKRIEGPVVRVDSRESGRVDLFGTIVCIENADPGFDWLFTRGIAGLVTKFGGSNSHMTIRCAEFAIPAAIGCGEYTFERVTSAPSVELNCAERILRPIYG